MEKKHVLLAVTGSIAAYKALDVVSRLNKADIDVRVILSPGAAHFVDPLSFETLSHHKVETSLFDPANPDPIAHISLAKWADLMAVVPASADIIGKMAAGLADDIVSTTFLAYTCPVWVFPAMNVHMYEHPAVQANLALLARRGVQVVEPASGHLACDDVGKGKLPDPATIVRILLDALQKAHSSRPLEGKCVLISAGPTQEALDPVRFLSNHSSGKQGYALARTARDMGARVILVSGPVSLDPPQGVEMVPVKSALEMFDAVKEYSGQADFLIMAAAVGDYRFENTADQKIKKSGDVMDVRLVRNPDILAWLGAHKKKNQILCGFAMETQNLEENAREKLEKKNCDLLIANNLFTEGAGFQTDTNVATLLLPQENRPLPKMSKEELSGKILEEMLRLEGERSC